ncbi:MAG: heavy-metal-associated domain-containing protein, partial [Clostridiales bacterium]|nr:heavy-metal-associated domain-containing protein [Clostridiales bacterium]
MKKVLEVEGLCCARCAERAEKKLRLLDGVSGAKANYKKGIVFVERNLPDEAWLDCVDEAGYAVKDVRIRKVSVGSEFV